MALSAAEQYLLELINRARLDPAGEAARYGITLNANLASGAISTSAKQVLAHSAVLEVASLAHSNWMIANDVFSHTGSGGSAPVNRAVAAGYTGYSVVGENIAWTGSTGTISMNSAISSMHEGLFRSAGHRLNMLTEDYREVGLGAIEGVFRQNGTNFNAAMLTEVFGTRGNAVFLTGVAYTDTNANSFYDIGEGRAAVTFTSQSKTAATASAGGYQLSLSADSTQDITGKVGTKTFSLQLDMGAGNAKLDVVGASTFFTSVDIVLKTGIHNARLLGVGNIDATGNSSANVLTGNKGANVLSGLSGADRLNGGAGRDRLDGGAGNDQLTGGSSADDFIFRNAHGRDRITDFSISSGDDLFLDDAIWGGGSKTAAQVVSQYAKVTGGVVVFTFSADETITLTGVTSTSGLAATIEIF